MNALGSLFYNEMRDYKQAAEWFKKAADRGLTRALNNLGMCYEFGHGVDRDRDAAFQLYREGAEKGSVEAMLNLAIMYFTNATRTHNMEQYREAQVWFRNVMLKEPDLWQPFYYLGQLHELGYGVQLDLKSAFQYFRRAAKIGHVESLVKCGDYIYSGRGLPSFGRQASKMPVTAKDKQEAFKCYKKAASMGSARAMNNLGLMLEKGFENQNPDLDASLALYTHAAKLGDKHAPVNLALLSQTHVSISLFLLFRLWPLSKLRKC